MIRVIRFDLHVDGHPRERLTTLFSTASASGRANTCCVHKFLPYWLAAPLFRTLRLFRCLILWPVARNCVCETIRRCV